MHFDTLFNDSGYLSVCFQLLLGEWYNYPCDLRSHPDMLAHLTEIDVACE